MSTNKSPISSRYNRKQNYESINYPPLSQPFSPARSTYQPNDPSLIKKSIQQKQIQDLQLKVDLILQHNDKLAAENADLKQKFVESQKIIATNSQKQRLSRYQIAEQSDFTARKLNSELIMKTRQLELALTELQAIKQVTRKQSLSMQDIITSLTLSNQNLKVQNLRLTQDQLKIKDQLETDHRLVIKQTQRKVQQEIFRLQKEKNEQLARQKAYWNKLNEELNQKFEQQRKQFNNRKNVLITKLQQNHSKQIEELREVLISQFNLQISKIEENSAKRCREQRQKADKLVKDYMDNFGQANNAQNEQLKHQIKTLMNSLQSRKKFIDQIVASDNERQNLLWTFKQIEQMKNRLKQEIQHLMRQNEMLKIKMTEKYQVDLKETIKIYEDKIEALSFQNRNLSDQNDRLRHNYQDQVTNKIRQRRSFQIEITQLKNVIRKLKAQLKGVQDQFRLNIDGVRDQNVSFSMTLMKSVIIEKDKTTFLQEQNRKLRELYDRHQKQVQIQKLQAQQKVKYYESKLEHMKKLIEQQKNEIRQKQEMLEKKLSQRQNKLRQSIKKERQRLQQLISQSDQARQRLEKQYFDIKEKYVNLQAEIKQARQDIEHLTSKIKQNQEHIQRLRMELQVAGIDQAEKNATIDNWKQHYERIILKLESDKKELKSIIDKLNQGNQRLTYREKLLEQQLKKANIQMSKRGELDRRVISLGLDQNLVKNMGELWSRSAIKKQN